MNLAELNLNLTADFWVLVKIVILFGLLFYLGFSIVIIRQAQLMTKTVAGSLDRVIRSISLGHFIFTAVIFVLVVIFL